MVQRLTLRKKRKSQNVRGKRRRMTYRKMVHKQTLGKKRKSQNVRGTRRIMTYKKTGRYNSEGGVVHAEEEDEEIEDKFVHKIPISIGQYFIDNYGKPLVQGTVYKYDYNLRAPPKARWLALKQILDLQNARRMLFNTTDPAIEQAFNDYKTTSAYTNKDAFAPLKRKLESNDYNGFIYFKITDEADVSPPVSPKSVTTYQPWW